MSIVKAEVKQVVYDYTCDQVGCTGSLRPSGFVLASSPPQYPHVCNKCGYEKTFRVSYPYHAYERV